MVSFFGLKFKGDKKRSQKKEAVQKWGATDGEDLIHGQYYGHNFSRPSTAVPSALRPGTSCSTRPAQPWTSVFGNSAAATSMTDLAPPVVGLRHNASEANLRSLAAARDSRPSLTLPTGTGGIGSASGDLRSASAMNLGSADSHGSIWDNALQIHQPRDVPTARPGTALSTRAASAAKKPLGRLDTESDVHVEALGAMKFKGSEVSRAGYPSPPQSDGNSDRCYSPYHPSIGRVSPESAAASPTTVTHDQPRPLLRHDAGTGSYRSTRRPSFTKERQGSETSLRKQQPAEGFVGNFADFNFGVCPLRPGQSGDARNDSVDSPSEVAPPQAVGVALTISTKNIQSLARTHPSTPTSPRKGLALTGDSPLSTIGADLERQLEGALSAPQIFPSRVDSIARSMRAPVPAPIITKPPSIPTDSPLASPASALQSPYGPPVDGIGHYMRKPLPPSPSQQQQHPRSRTSSLGDASSRSRMGLPRGRITEPSQLSASSTVSSFAEAEGGDFGDGRAISEDEDEDDDDDDGDIGPILAAWPSFDPTDPRNSAIPPPLTPSSRSPTETTTSFCPSPAPRIPSPTFPSLLSSSSLSLDLSSSFELALAETLAVGGAGGTSSSPKRVEAPRAPPRPEVPLTLPPATSFSERQRERGVSISPRRPAPQPVRIGFI